MTKGKKIVWRLSDLPEAGEVADLVNAGVLDKDEAREILLKEVDKEDDSEKIKYIETELEFYRDMVKDLISKLERQSHFTHYHYEWTPPRPNVWLSTSGTTAYAITANSITTTTGSLNMNTTGGKITANYVNNNDSKTIV